jgi:hypothetical protein
LIDSYFVLLDVLHRVKIKVHIQIICAEMKFQPGILVSFAETAIRKRYGTLHGSMDCDGESMTRNTVLEEGREYIFQAGYIDGSSVSTLKGHEEKVDYENIKQASYNEIPQLHLNSRHRKQEIIVGRPNGKPFNIQIAYFHATSISSSLWNLLGSYLPTTTRARDSVRPTEEEEERLLLSEV